MRVQVIGGGALGCSAALALAEAGHEVVLDEARSLGAGASSKAAGILSSFAWSDADYRLIAETRGAIGEAIALAMAAGERHARGAWRPTSSLVVARGDAGLAALDTLQDRVERHTEECERLDHRAAAAAFPGVLFAPGEQAIVAQEDGVIEAGDLLAALRARLAQEGVTVREGRGVRDRPGGGAGEGRPHGPPGQSAPPGPRPDVVVVAGGAWTGPLLRSWGIHLPLLSYRTQLCSLQMPDAGELPIVHDLAQHFYTRPESAGSMLAGDGTQLRPFDADDYDEAADPEFIASVAERVVARFERGAEATVRAGWAGLCVGTPDRRPLCGPVPGHEGLHVLTGDNGFGLMRCLALGSRLADAVGGRPHADLDPGRFGPSPPATFALREGYGAPA